MKPTRRHRIAIAAVLVACLATAGTVLARNRLDRASTSIVAYFANSNGIYEGDDVMILGVPVGSIDRIEPQPLRAKITFHVDRKYRVPGDVNAVIISPTLVSARAIQLTPAYTGGVMMRPGGVIPQERTAVPVEFDDLREQLEKLTESLQPAEPGGVSTLGEFVNTAADNLRGQGAHIREGLVELSHALSTLGNHRDDVFGTLRNLAVLVSALRSSSDLLRQLNGNLASVTGLLANDSNEVGNAVESLNDVVVQTQGFIADNREPLGIASEKLASISQAIAESLDDIKQTLHVAPTAFANFVNSYEPAHASVTGTLALNNFANPVQFLCSVVQAASRLNLEQSAKLCVQYMAPIVKNRQYNFLALGANAFVGAQARPNEVTFSEDWLRAITEAGRIRDFYEGPPPASGQSDDTAGPPPDESPDQPAAPGPSAESTPTDPAAGLPGMMVPPGGRS